MAVCHEIFRWPEKANWGAINFMGGIGSDQLAPCGGLTGAATAMGMMFGKDADTREQAREARKKARAAARRVYEGFRQEFGNTMCRELVKRDFDQPGVFQQFVNEGGFEQHCDRYVSWLVRELLKMAEEEGIEPSPE